MAASDSGKADLHDAIDRATDTLADANTPEASREDLVAVGEAHATRLRDEAAGPLAVLRLQGDRTGALAPGAPFDA